MERLHVLVDQLKVSLVIVSVVLLFARLLIILVRHDLGPIELVHLFFGI